VSPRRHCICTGNAGGEGLAVRWAAGSARVGLGLVAPLVLWIVEGPAAPLAMILCCLTGEVIDRAEFYEGMEIVTPARQMSLDLAAELQRLPSRVVA